MLRAALWIVGSETALAEVLHADTEKVHSWLSGDPTLPNQEFFTVLDIVAHGPLIRPPVH
jgi:hypothetical protein